MSLIQSDTQPNSGRHFVAQELPDGEPLSATPPNLPRSQPPPFESTIYSSMGASILLVGTEDFRSALLSHIQAFVPSTLEVAEDAVEAMLLIQAQQPDLLLLQAQLIDQELCRQIKAQTRLAWIYCIVLDDTQDDSTDSTASLSRQVSALESGADAFLCFDLLTNEADPIGRQLLQAQIQVGLRQVQTHRELMRTNDLLSAIALSDPLTDLNNRRALEWELPRQIGNARNRNQPISLVMLDVDFFKGINDTYGHLVGDRALEILATRLRHNLRIYDTPFRYGGEEFVVLLSDTDQPEAAMIANRICQLIREQPFAVDTTLNLRVTISAGTATLSPTDDTKGISLLERADQRLLQAKAEGRDRVVSGD